jgi:hypothetical protein
MTRIRALSVAISSARPPWASSLLVSVRWVSSGKNHLATVFSLPGSPFLGIVGGAAFTPSDVRGDLNFSKKFWRQVQLFLEISSRFPDPAELRSQLSLNKLLYSSSP